MLTNVTFFFVLTGRCDIVLIKSESGTPLRQYPFTTNNTTHITSPNLTPKPRMFFRYI